MRITEMTKKLKSLNSEIRAVLRDSGFSEYNEFSPDEYQTNRKIIEDEDGCEDDVADLTPDEWQLVREYGVILDKLDGISDRLTYLSKPITHEGRLYVTANDRYAVDDVEFCCGYRVEYQEYDEEYQSYKWVLDRVEYSDKQGGYYLYGHSKPLCEGMAVRVRW